VVLIVAKSGSEEKKKHAQLVGRAKLSACIKSNSVQDSAGKLVTAGVSESEEDLALEQHASW